MVLQNASQTENLWSIVFLLFNTKICTRKITKLKETFLINKRFQGFFYEIMERGILIFLFNSIYLRDCCMSIPPKYTNNRGYNKISNIIQFILYLRFHFSRQDRFQPFLIGSQKSSDIKRKALRLVFPIKIHWITKRK